MNGGMEGNNSAERSPRLRESVGGAGFFSEGGGGGEHPTLDIATENFKLVAEMEMTEETKLHACFSVSVKRAQVPRAPRDAHDE